MKLVILDRDGVINHDSDEYIKSPAEWEAIPGSCEAIAALRQYGYKVFVVTNQSGLGRGLYDIDTLNQIHFKMQTQIEQAGGKIEAIFFCPHTPDDGCDCRKPKPGLLDNLAERLQTSLVDVPFIGDSYRDIEAGRAVKCKPILVMTGKGSQTLAKHQADLADVPVFENLSSAVKSILKQKN